MEQNDLKKNILFLWVGLGMTHGISFLCMFGLGTYVGGVSLFFLLLLGLWLYSYFLIGSNEEKSFRTWQISALISLLFQLPWIVFEGTPLNQIDPSLFMTSFFLFTVMIVLFGLFVRWANTEI